MMQWFPLLGVVGLVVGMATGTWWCVLAMMIPIGLLNVFMWYSFRDWVTGFREQLATMVEHPRQEGAACLTEKNMEKLIKVDELPGAIFLSGATGFVGSAILFTLLARAKELRISRIVLIVRPKHGVTAQERLQGLQSNSTFAEVREQFLSLVSVLEGEVTQDNFGWPAEEGHWPYDEELSAYVHCASDVRFDRPLQEAAALLVGSTQLAVEMAARWKAKRLVFVSTAFVHPSPKPDGCPEELVDFLGNDPLEIYRDACRAGQLASRVMSEMGFVNTYVYMKAVAEHVFVKLCADRGVSGRIARPAIVGPSWAAPWAGWSGEAASTVTMVFSLFTAGVVSAAPFSESPAPVVPVDMVAETIVNIAASTRDTRQIYNVVQDKSSSSLMNSFRSIEQYMVSAAVSGNLSRFRSCVIIPFGLKACESQALVDITHMVFNLMPLMVMEASLWIVGLLPGSDTKAWNKLAKAANKCRRIADLMRGFSSFSNSKVPWVFDSQVGWPPGWNREEYGHICGMAAIPFSMNKNLKPERGLRKSLCELRKCDAQ